MIGIRWRKVLRDLWLNRARTILIVLTIAVSVFAVGTIVASQVILQEQLPGQYAKIDPPHLLFTTSEFEPGLVDSIESIDGVAAVEARRNIQVRMKTNPNEQSWRDLYLFGIEDFDEQKVNRVWHTSGGWPPPKETLLMERGSMTYLNLREGQSIIIKTSGGKERRLTISGVAHDLYHMPAIIEGTVYAFVTDDTLRWLGEEALYNELHVRLKGDIRNADYMRMMTEKITDRIEGEDLLVYTTFRPAAGSYPLDYIANTVLLLLTMLGVLILLLGVFLIINSISALVAQQTRQIGVIKAVGGRTGQISGIYLGMVTILGLIGTLLAIPFTITATREFVRFLGDQFNYVINPEQFPYWVILVQVAAGILIPVLAALVPVLNGAKQPPAQALSEYGKNQVWSGMLTIDRILRRIKGLSRTVIFAIRNPFRKHSRLVLSLIMLSIAGGSFITVINLRASLTLTVDRMLDFWSYDYWLDLNKPTLVDRLPVVASKVPGVSQVEGWGFEMSRRVRPDGSESNPLFLFGVPADTTMLRPNVIKGRWLLPDDANAVVVGMGLLDVEPDLAVGKPITVKINGDERTLTVVGVIEMLGNQTVGYLAYMPYNTYSTYSNQENRADMAIVKTTASTLDEKKAIGTALENAFEDAGISVRSVVMTEDERMEINSSFGIIVVLLLFMVLLLSFVGGLGLTGTMSLNVIDRSREIGVIRAFGGSDQAVTRIVVIEGVVIGVISWFFSLILALPLTWLFCDMIGHSFLNMGLAYRYSFWGALLWLVLVIVLAVLSSSLPARSASRLTVREVLSYE
ncbi:hypothetical protein hrd7_05480 [Leptolinea sp. HRD-7]|nr:hypothetical protein hrd7_05480 [Leptolinea sp. HRD-7]